ncbi:RluA family pseudouridine synthase [Patescibacteria group bacterium]|nr:RluA family pseudouridine synthase [Patescibacteria group bacterium]
MPLKILYEDDTVSAVDKTAGIDAEQISGRVHRLDKDTSGVLLLAKSDGVKQFLQKQFQERKVQKTYICLVVGTIKEDNGRVETLLGRSPADRRKQRVYPLGNPQTEGMPAGRQGRRDAITEYRVLKRYINYTLLEVIPKTGRKHQIRAHMVHLGHPIAGDKLYGFKNQSVPTNLERQFLHAKSLSITMPNGKKKKFTSELPQDLQKVLDALSMLEE